MSELNQFFTLKKLIENAEKHIDEVDVVSFDVFDTLFIRRIENPDIVKVPVSRFIEKSAHSVGREAFYINLLHHRGRVENKWRQINGAKGPDHEANYDVFMPEFLNEVFADKLPDNFFQQVADYEIKIENSVLVVREEILNWIKSLRQRGKRLFLLSDMYLPAEYLRQFTDDKGISDYFEDIMSSADSLQAKASGAAYPLMQEKHQLDKQRWIHIGDNVFSDGLRAQEFGIRSFLIRDYKEKHRKKIARKYNLMAAKQHIWKGRNLMQAMMPLEAENQPLPELSIDGHNFFGFLFGYFLQRIGERCRELKLNKIYFCSREGWLLEKCWKQCAPHFFPHGDIPQTHYLYVSRLALAKAMCANTGLSYRVISIVFLPPKNKTFKDLCRVFDLDIEDYLTHLENHHLTPDTIISPHDNKDGDVTRKLEELIHDNDFQNQVKAQTLQHRDMYNEYLEQIGFFEDNDVAFVDIGWLGSIQNFFYNAISHQEKKPNIHGMMMAATRYLDYPQTPQNYFEGLVYDGFKVDFSASVIEYIRDIFEEITRAPHPTLIGFNKQDGIVQPVFRSTNDAVGKNEQIQTEHYAPAQDGIVLGTKRYAQAQELFGYSSEELKSWLKLLLIQRIAYPRAQEVERLSILEHIDDFGGKDTTGKKNKLEGLSSVWSFSQQALKYLPFTRFFAHRLHVRSKCKYY